MPLVGGYWESDDAWYPGKNDITSLNLELLTKSEYPEVTDMRAFYLRECEPRYVHGRSHYGTTGPDRGPLENVNAAIEEAADLLAYLRWAQQRLEPQQGRLRIYIAGPYRAKTPEGTDAYIAAAREVQAELLRLGHSPFCPHTMTARFERSYPDIPDTCYLRTDLDWLPFCHAIYLLSGWHLSEGARAELAVAQKLHLKEFRSLEEVPPPLVD